MMMMIAMIMMVITITAGTQSTAYVSDMVLSTLEHSMPAR